MIDRKDFDALMCFDDNQFDGLLDRLHGVVTIAEQMSSQAGLAPETKSIFGDLIVASSLAGLVLSIGLDVVKEAAKMKALVSAGITIVTANFGTDFPEVTEENRAEIAAEVGYLVMMKYVAQKEKGSIHAAAVQNGVN